MINTCTHSDIMVLANHDEDPENSHPYWYARVIGIFHPMVSQVGSGTAYKQIDFLWVRWYGFDMHARSGFKARRLHQVGFLDSNVGAGAFGFINPLDVVRAVHLIPAFHFGKTSILLSPSIARRDDEGDEDYQRYYINMFVPPLFVHMGSRLTIESRSVDQDMFVHLCGFGPDHKSTCNITKVFRNEIKEALA